MITRDRLLVLDVSGATGTAAVRAASAQAAAAAIGDAFYIEGGDDGAAKTAAMEPAATETDGPAESPPDGASGELTKEPATAPAEEGGTAQAAAGSPPPDVQDQPEVDEDPNDLLDASVVVKSNHHLTEIVKMTLLKKVPQRPP